MPRCFGERDAFVVDERGVFDGSDARADGVLDSFRCVRVGFYAKAEVLGFVDRSLQLFGSEFDRFRIAAVRQHRAGREHLDVIGAAMREEPHFLANFPRAVGFAVAQIPGKSDVGREAGHSAGAAGDSDVRACNVHARANDVAESDSVAQRDVI